MQKKSLLLLFFLFSFGKIFGQYTGTQVKLMVGTTTVISNTNISGAVEFPLYAQFNWDVDPSSSQLIFNISNTGRTLLSTTVFDLVFSGGDFGSLSSVTKNLVASTSPAVNIPKLTALNANTLRFTVSSNLIADGNSGKIVFDIVAISSIPAAPTLTTSAATSINRTGATIGGNITAGESITERGFVYSVNPDPMIGGAGVSKVIEGGTNTGTFTATLSSLPSATYYYKAYAINNGGTSYGEVKQFTTATDPIAISRNVTVNLGADGSASLSASSVNNGSTGIGTLTYTIQKVIFGRVNEGQTLTLLTPNGENISQVRFASYGTSIDNGNGNYVVNTTCNASNSLIVAQNSYVGRSLGSMDAANGASANNNPVLGDPCSGVGKSLAVVLGYSADAVSLTYNCLEANKTNYVLLTVNDSNGNTSSTVVATVTVNPPLTATLTNALPNPAIRSTTVNVTGTNLSAATGLTVNGAVATISNLTSTSFSFVVPAGASNSGNMVLQLPCSQSITRAFSAVTAPTITIAPATFPDGSAGTFYSQSVTASGGTASYTYIISSGYLPNGLTLSSEGTLSGIPSTSGSFSFTVQATDSSIGTGPYSSTKNYTVSISGPLPVSLLSYTAKAQGNTARLNWSTAAEQNNGFFSIFRSIDRKSFAVIGSVVGHGTTVSKNDYVFYDRSPLNGPNYYKLVQTDNDGKVEEIGMQALSFEISANATMLYPNPATTEVTLTFSTGIKSIELIDQNGNRLQQLSIEKSATSAKLNLTNLPSGIYLIRLEGTTTEIKKLVKL